MMMNTDSSNDVDFDISGVSGVSEDQNEYDTNITILEPVELSEQEKQLMSFGSIAGLPGERLVKVEESGEVEISGEEDPHEQTLIIDPETTTYFHMSSEFSSKKGVVEEKEEEEEDNETDKISFFNSEFSSKKAAGLGIGIGIEEDNRKNVNATFELSEPSKKGGVIEDAFNVNATYFNLSESSKSKKGTEESDKYSYFNMSMSEDPSSSSSSSSQVITGSREEEGIQGLPQEEDQGNMTQEGNMNMNLTVIDPCITGEEVVDNTNNNKRSSFLLESEEKLIIDSDGERIDIPQDEKKRHYTIARRSLKRSVSPGIGTQQSAAAVYEEEMNLQVDDDDHHIEDDCLSGSPEV